MPDTQKKDPFLSTKLRIAGNVAGAIYTHYARQNDGWEPVDMEVVTDDAVRLTTMIFERLTGGSRG